MKKCTKCGEEKEEGEFHAWRGQCKASARQKKYKEAHRENLKEKRKEQYWKNPEIARAKTKAWALTENGKKKIKERQRSDAQKKMRKIRDQNRTIAQKEKKKLYDREWRIKNAKEISMRMKIYRDEHKEQLRARDKARANKERMVRRSNAKKRYEGNRDLFIVQASFYKMGIRSHYISDEMITLKVQHLALVREIKKHKEAKNG